MNGAQQQRGRCQCSPDCAGERLLKCPSCEREVCGDHWDLFDGICRGCAEVIEQLPG